jgi:hypothetical protein
MCPNSIATNDQGFALLGNITSVSPVLKPSKKIKVQVYNECFRIPSSPDAVQ